KYASMSRENMVSAKSCGKLHNATVQLMMRMPPEANSYFPRYCCVGRRSTRPRLNQPQIMPQAPTVNSTVPRVTPHSVVRNGANHCAELIPEFGATQPTDQEPTVSTTEPSSPTAIAGQACRVMPFRAVSRVAINNFQ